MATSDHVRELFEERSNAMAAKDIDRLMALYSDDIVYFDLVPPLRYSGSDALRARFLDWFGRWQGPVGQEVHELTVVTDVHVATAHMLIRAHGTLVDHRTVDYFVRVSNACVRSRGRWVFVHEHVSLPVDVASGTAAMNLTPSG